jgi:hypothetical protein
VLQPFGGDRRRDRRSDGGRHRRQPAQGMISIASRRTMKSPYLKSSLASYRAASSEELDLAKSGGSAPRPSGTGGLQTPRRRATDSNPRSPVGMGFSRPSIITPMSSP